MTSPSVGFTGLIAELRRRNVFRMAGLYLVGAWLVTQVAGTLLPMFEAPQWIARAVVILLAIGFVPALVFAWIFELTPQGIRRDADVPPQHSIAPQTARRLDRAIIVVLTLALGYFAVDKFVLAPRQSVPSPHMSDEITSKSIAVLPFIDLSPAKDQEYFSDGMSEELLNALAKVKDLKVAGRTSSFSFKGKNEDMRTIGAALGVANIVEGSVRKQGDKVRITAQLVQATNGFHLWSQTYDGDLKDVFELQERIARAITDELRVVLQGDQKTRLVPVATTSPEAYSLYLKATAIFNRRDGAHFDDAIADLERAIELDPKFARAFSRLAVIYSVAPQYLQSTDLNAARDAAQRNAVTAIALDPTLAEPLAALALSDRIGHRYVEEREGYERALALDPDDVTAIFWFGLTELMGGYTRHGMELLDRALSIDPKLPNALRWRAKMHIAAGDLDAAAIDAQRRAIKACASSTRISPRSNTPAATTRVPASSGSAS
jgi:TolB-like protein/Tfp pilus assembly protein PilF